MEKNIKNDIELGKIYTIKENVEIYDEEIYNHRPVIVLKKHEEYIEVVSLNISFAHSLNNKKLYIEYFSNNIKYFGVVSCDVLKKIPYEYLEYEIGDIKYKTYRMIYCMVYEKQVVGDVVNGTYIQNVTNNKKQFELLYRIKNKVEKGVQIAEDSKRKIYVFKERLIGFVLGIIASIVANLIWENLNKISFWLKGILK